MNAQTALLIKSDIKLLKTDVKNIQDEPIFSVNVTFLGECMKKWTAFDKKTNKLEKRVHGEQTQSAAMTSKAATGTGSSQPPSQKAYIWPK